VLLRRLSVLLWPSWLVLPSVAPEVLLSVVLLLLLPEAVAVALVAVHALAVAASVAPHALAAVAEGASALPLRWLLLIALLVPVASVLLLRVSVAVQVALASVVRGLEGLLRGLRLLLLLLLRWRQSVHAWRRWCVGLL
jgi:hypothetical protein